MTATWHVDPDRLDRYLLDDVDEAVAASIEAHLLACASCRRAVAERSAPTELDRSWAAIESRIDADAVDPAVRVGRRIGFREVDLRLIAPTWALRRASLLAMVAALLVAWSLAERNVGLGVSWTRLAFLLIAPLIPLAAVVGAVGAASEPEPDLARATPLSRLYIGALRAGVSLAGTLLIVSLISLFDAGDWTRIGLWVLPSLALASVGALGAKLAPPTAVVGGIAVGWTAAVIVAAQLTDDRLAAFRIVPQATYLLVVVAVVATIALRPSILELREST